MNINLILLIIFLLIAIYYFYSKSIIEYITNINGNTRKSLFRNKNIFLLGDNILSNSDYIKQDENVSYLLKINYPNYNIYNFAKNNAKINDVYNQLKLVDIDFNTSNTYIFLSVGQNDILSYNFHIDIQHTNKLFNKYIDLIKLIKKKLPKANIILFKLFLPLNSNYKKYYNIIKHWNNLIEENRKIGYKIIETNNLLVSPKDFIYDIELSNIGFQKIVNSIEQIML